MVAVAMDAGRRKNRGQAVQGLQSGEAQGGTARGIGLGEEVEDLVGTVADEVEAFESEGRPGAITNQPFEPLSVLSFDADAGIEAEPTAVIPGEHVLGVVGFKQDLTPKVP